MNAKNWEQYSELILEKLETHDGLLEKILEKQGDISADHRILKNDNEQFKLDIKDHERRLLSLETKDTFFDGLHEGKKKQKEHSWSRNEKVLGVCVAVAMVWGAFADRVVHFG